MSTLKVNNLQVGQDATASNNFTLYQPATPNGTVKLGVGNTGSVTDLVTVTSVGNVGIGTSTPINYSNQRSLTVYGSSVGRVDVIGGAGNGGQLYSTAAEFVVFGGYATPLVLRGGATSYTSIGVNAAEAIRIDVNQNVGIGVTNPSKKLDVNGHISSNNTVSADTTNGSVLIRNLGGSSANNAVECHIRPSSGKSGYLSFTEDSIADRWSIGIQNGNGSLRFLNGTAAAGTEVVTFSSNGNVGIGTTSATALFGGRALQLGNVADDRSVLTLASVNRGSIYFADGTAGGSTYVGYIDYVHTGTFADNLIFGTGSTARVLINASGNVGIGELNPSSKLHVQGTSYFGGRMFVQPSATSGSTGYVQYPALGYGDFLQMIVPAGNYNSGSNTNDYDLEGMPNSSSSDANLITYLLTVRTAGTATDGGTLTWIVILWGSSTANFQTTLLASKNVGVSPSISISRVDPGGGAPHKIRVSGNNNARIQSLTAIKLN